MSQLSSSQWTELLPASVSLSWRSIVAGRVLMQREWTKAVQICGLKIACYLSCASVGVCSHCSFRVSIYQLKETETLSLCVDYCSERSAFILFPINVKAGWLQEARPCCSDFMKVLKRQNHHLDLLQPLIMNKIFLYMICAVRRKTWRIDNNLDFLQPSFLILSVKITNDFTLIPAQSKVFYIIGKNALIHRKPHVKPYKCCSNCTKMLEMGLQIWCQDCIFPL